MSGGAQPQGADWERFKTLGEEYALGAHMCPFNDEGALRRVSGAAYHLPLGARARQQLLLHAGSGGHPKVVSHPSLDEAVQEATNMYGRAASGLAGGDRERALPTSVAWALGRGSG